MPVVPPAVTAFAQIWRHEGIRGIQSGLGPALLFQVALNGTRLGAYTTLRAGVVSALGEDRQYLASVLAGATAGALGALVGSPFNLVKCRMQAQSPHFKALEQHTYRNGWDALRQIFKGMCGACFRASAVCPPLPPFHPRVLTRVCTADGFAGLYRGALASMVRISIGSGVQLSTYDTAKRAAMTHLGVSDGLGAHVAASAIAGLLVAVMMNPFDVVSTRLYNQVRACVPDRGACETSSLSSVSCVGRAAPRTPRTLDAFGTRCGLKGCGGCGRAQRHSTRALGPTPC